MMVAIASDQLYVAPALQPVFRELGIDAETVFSHALIRPWRTLSDRENCTLDATLVDGTQVRWHVKRYPSARRTPPAETELAGHRDLEGAGIPTASLVAWGVLHDRRSFVIFDDLSGFSPADKLVERGVSFDTLLQPTAALAARLHDAGLHHRDLYLCHFMARVEGSNADVRLIDTARVRKLPRLTRRRWIVKDLAQFWYSTQALGVTDAMRRAWLDRYATLRNLAPSSLVGAIERKVRQIARHDRKLNIAQPSRHVSIPVNHA